MPNLKMIAPSGYKKRYLKHFLVLQLLGISVNNNKCNLVAAGTDIFNFKNCFKFHKNAQEFQFRKCLERFSDIFYFFLNFGNILKEQLYIIKLLLSCVNKYVSMILNNKIEIKSY